MLGVALEPDAALAEYMSSTVQDVDIRVEVIEDADLPAVSFDIAIAATAFHWIDPVIGHRKVFEALKPSGWWAMWWNVFGDPTQPDPFHEATLRLLERLGRGPAAGAGGFWPFALEEDGQISPIVKTRFGYHIIMRTEREDGQLKSFDDVKNQIRIRLINEKRRTNTQDFLDTLKTTSNYELDEDTLVSIDLTDMDAGEDGGADAPAAHPHLGGH